MTLPWRINQLSSGETPVRAPFACKSSKVKHCYNQDMKLFFIQLPESEIPACHFQYFTDQVG